MSLLRRAPNGARFVGTLTWRATDLDINLCVVVVGAHQGLRGQLGAEILAKVRQVRASHATTMARPGCQDG